MLVLFSEEQEKIHENAKKTIETATAKCKSIEEKMKVCYASCVKFDNCFTIFGCGTLISPSEIDDEMIIINPA